MPRPSSRQIFGNWVVLPEPVSPAITTTWWAAMAALISSRLAAIGEAVVVADRRHAGAPRLDLGAGGLEALDPLRQARVVGLLAQFVELPAQAVAVADLGLVEAPDELVREGVWSVI